MPLCCFTNKNYLNKVQYFSKIYYHTTFQYHILNSIRAAPVKQVPIPTMLLFPVYKIKKEMVCSCISLIPNMVETGFLVQKLKVGSTW
jgi:hypothetical protein